MPTPPAPLTHKARRFTNELQGLRRSVDVADHERFKRMSASRARLGRYLPEALLGQGSVTLTYRARVVEPLSTVDAKIFTLKVLRQEAQGADIESRFVDAARALQWSPLPGTAQVVEIGQSPGPVFAAFEFKEGVNLHQLRAQAVAEDGRMDARVVGLVGRKLAERLSPLHAQPDGPRKHGCLSPGNVLIRPTGEILLLDCGFGEALHTEAGWPSESWHYAAPEQLRGEPASSASDLYALGALMHFLCYGRPPFDADTPEAIEARIAQGPPDLDGLHPSVAAVMTRLLSYAPADRPKSAADATRQISVALLSANAGIHFVTPAPMTVAPVTRPSGDLSPFSEPEDAGQDGALDAPASDDAVDGEEVQHFAFVPQSGAAASHAGARVGISADDPDVGAVFDDDDDEDEIEVAADGTVKRRRRRRAIRLLEWTKSAFARKIFRYAWVPVAVALAVGAAEGYFFVKSWRAARAQSQQRDAALASELARREAAKPKLSQSPAIPPGHLEFKVAPAGATVWLDGKEVGSTPSTILTSPGAHRLVITASGYRMLRDVIDTSKGVVFEREMVRAIFPLTGSVGLNVACTTEGKYPVFIDGKEIGALCPISGVRLDPGKHMVGVFVISENRIWTLDREIIAEHPHRVQFNY
jgi:serine/threonine protein kinase